jgi:hypothetical protein
MVTHMFFSEGGDPISAALTAKPQSGCDCGQVWPSGQGRTSVIGVRPGLLFLNRAKEVDMPKLRNGHAPGHVREAARDAFEAWLNWDVRRPDPTVDYEVGYVPRPIPISKMCGIVWNCTDIVPGDLFNELRDALNRTGRTVRTRTYGACARAILKDIKRHSSFG